MDAFGIAKGLRADNGYTGRGGVMVLFNGKWAGWVNELRNPEHWEPGCVAVSEDGQSWTAQGGNDWDGALMWVPNEPR